MARPPSETHDLSLRPVDFERFRPEVQRDPIHNAARLEVRRKLDGIGKLLAKSLAAPDLTLTSRASLHHPFRFNRFRVESQWVYLSRGDKERRELKKILGVELGKDLDQNYVHVILVLEVHHEGLEIALRIHKDAWWDGENLKRRVKTTAGREEIASILRTLPESSLRIHDHRRHHPCGELGAPELRETFGFYTPGEHWLHIWREYGREDPFVTESGFPERLTEEFRRLVPLYRAIRWSPANNHLFG